VKTAQSGRPILALDGCALACVSACLARAGVTADKHLLLSEYGVKKRRTVGFDEVLAAEVYVRQALPAALGLAGRDHAHGRECRRCGSANAGRDGVNRPAPRPPAACGEFAECGSRRTRVGRPLSG
jgi:hypothetical protein